MNSIFATIGILIFATIGILSTLCGICLAELARSYEQEHRILEFMSRRGWLQFRDFGELEMSPIETESWLQHLVERGKVVQSIGGRYWRARR